MTDRRGALASVALPLAGVGAAAGGVAAVVGRQLVEFAVRRNRSLAIDPPSPCFYLPFDTAVAGQPFDLHVHCPAGGELTLRRLERVSTPAPVVLKETIDPISGNGTYDLWRGLEWPPLTFSSESEWKPGLYLAELSSGSDRYRQAVIVTGPEPAALSVVVSTNTWAAYNDFGGLSNYDDHVLPHPLRELFQVARLTNRRMVLGERRYLPTVPLPAHRPNARVHEDLADLEADPVTDLSHLVRAEWALLRHLDGLGVDYNVYSDHDFAFNSGPTASRLVIFTAHSEYWSAEMMGRFSAYIGSGGRALFMSGNNWYRQVKHLEHGLEVIDQKLDAGFVAGVLGTGYTADGYETSAPFRVVDADHPVFAGLDLTAGDVFGGPDGDGNGASGYETDKLNASSGVVDVLAVGLNPEGPAFMTWKDDPGGSGGWVANMSSVGSAPWAERCPTFGAVVNNIIDLGLR